MIMRTICRQIYQSPCGNLILAADDEKLYMCDWVENRKREITDKKILFRDDTIVKDAINSTLEHVIVQLDEYFGGLRRSFDVDVEMMGTSFQLSVWNELCKIEYGKTFSYKNIADNIKRPNCVRAVAGAIGNNPVSIIVPCHRVIGSNGLLTGYAGGLEAKHYLLNLEQAR